MENLLGEFLRARRQATTVERAGVLRGAGSRRTPGLRRGEVATLAGVSVDYYTRLEQGRERNPSDAVLNALARVFGLDYEATGHLHELARSTRGSFRRTYVADRVSPSVLRLVNNWEHALAFVVNRRLDVLVQNAETAAFLEGFSDGDNLLRLTFLNPASREFFLDWEQEARFKVAHMRAAVGADLDDPSVLALVEELSLASEDFRRIWESHDIQVRPHEIGRYHHDRVGDLTLWHATFSIDGAPGQRLFVAHAEPGTPSDDALTRLSASRC
ncbi:helix-turn-helix domain-containing protein [Microbispora corallina]|uniref:helix-turn-helix domain-containing protein n=1 Tax=Microbispora corallina TaxID=83302 RepID=UPI00195232AE|nr:helix-turn-helix transcriptional regulator [Microbispora corallina]